MANYRQIHVSIWKDEWFLELESDEKLLFIYLFSNELASLSGLYKISLKVIAFETGLPVSFVSASMEKFARMGKAYYADGLLWVKNLRRYNQGSSKIEVRINKDVDAIPACPLKQMYLAYYENGIGSAYCIDTLSENQDTLSESADTLSSEMKCNEEEMKGKEEEGKAEKTPPPLPRTPLEASQHPDIMLFRRVSGMFPGMSDYQEIVDAATLLRRAHPDETELESYLLPFWLRWQGMKRKDGKAVNLTNPTWFVEWAVGNYTPPPAAEKVPVPANSSKAALANVRAKLQQGNL